MTRLRFIADNPRGPHGGHNDVRSLFAEPTSAMRNVSKRADKVHGGRVLIVDLDELPTYGADSDDEFAYAERQMLRWTQIVQELRPERSDPTVAPAPDPIRLTAADIRVLALAAKTWLDSTGKTTAEYHKKRKAERDLQDALHQLFAAEKLPRDVMQSMFYGALDGASNS